MRTRKWSKVMGVMVEIWAASRCDTGARVGFWGQWDRARETQNGGSLCDQSTFEEVLRRVQGKPCLIVSLVYWMGPLVVLEALESIWRSVQRLNPSKHNQFKCHQTWWSLSPFVSYVSYGYLLVYWKIYFL